MEGCSATAVADGTRTQRRDRPHRSRQAISADASTRSAGSPVKTCLLIGCGQHDVALVRKSSLLGVKTFWGGVTRMCHLFESSSFRDQVRGAVACVVKSAFQRVTAAPPQARETPADVLRRFGAGLTLETSHALAQIDQGNVHTSNFIVWDPQDSLTEADALERMTSAYQAIVADITVQVPLLYRWKHALPALHFYSDKQQTDL